MVVDLLSMLSLVASGLAAGILTGVALANVPSFAVMPPDRYVATHQLLDRHYEPLMPLLVLGAAVVDVVLAVVAALAADGARAALFAVAAAALGGVAVISRFANVPLLRPLRSADPTALPVDWSDPRPGWRRWHRARTALAVLSLIVTAAAVIR